jgi:hypothetical protein
LNKLRTMIEAVGNLVVINGQFIVIDHTDKADDGKGFATVVNVYSLVEPIKEREIHTVVRSFCSGSGGCLVAGNTRFSFTHIWRSNSGNDPMLENHKEQTKMVAVLNQETDEFFLVMSDTVSLRAAQEFLYVVNKEHSPLLKAKELSFEHFRNLVFPHETMLGELKVSGNPKFEVVTNGGMAAIKLWES